MLGPQNLLILFLVWLIQTLQMVPFFLIVFPYFSMNINDPSILSSLTSNIKTKNMNFVEKAQTIAIIYRIYYKVITIQLNPRVVCQFVKD